MSYIPGRKGATRAAYDPYNPMILVKRLCDENPTADLPEIQRLVRGEYGVNNNRYLAAHVDYATANLYDRVVNGERATQTQPRTNGAAAVTHVSVTTAASAAATAQPTRAQPTLAEIAARVARRADLAAQVDKAAERRVIARFADDTTQHDLWKIGSKFGKKNSYKNIWTLFSEIELAKEGILRA
jgi:hypothetical protein